MHMFSGVSFCWGGGGGGESLFCRAQRGTFFTASSYAKKRGTVSEATPKLGRFWSFPTQSTLNFLIFFFSRSNHTYQVEKHSIATCSTFC